MDFSFSRDQLLFQDNVRSFLINEVTPNASANCGRATTGAVISSGHNWWNSA